MLFKKIMVCDDVNSMSYERFPEFDQIWCNFSSDFLIKPFLIRKKVEMVNLFMVCFTTASAIWEGEDRGFIWCDRISYRDLP